jgi:hypothetical protein
VAEAEHAGAIVHREHRDRPPRAVARPSRAIVRAVESAACCPADACDSVSSGNPMDWSMFLRRL